jgi:RNA polymerase sigma-70 factor (ECF subfamily)
MNELDQWFTATILPHDTALVRYLHRAWRNTAEIPDLCQEIYIRIYQSAARRKPDSPKSFLFATARNLLADRARHESVVTIDYMHDPDALGVLRDDLSPEHQHEAREDLIRIAAAFDRLPESFREIIWLRRVEGLSQKEVARRLDIKEGTVESRLGRAMLALSQSIAENVMEPASGEHLEEHEA